MTEFLYYFLLFGALACCIVAPILAFTSVALGNITTSRSSSYKETEEELKKQTDIMQRNRQEAWSNPNYFKQEK